MGQQPSITQLSEAEVQLVADLAGDFADRWRAGEAVSVEDYLDRLPSDRLRQEFIEIVNLDRFIQVMEDRKMKASR